VKKPGGFPTAHQPFPVDIDGDGRDEILAGYAMLNPDGQIRWVLENAAGVSAGHLDCCRVLQKGKTPKACRLVITTCGAHKLLVVDGHGKVQGGASGHHFESIDIGRIQPGREGAQILVDLVDDNSLWILDENCDVCGKLKTEYARFHTLVDWNGDGVDEIVIPHSRGLFDFQGKRIGTFDMEPQADAYGGMPPKEGEIGNILLSGDMTGDGVPDITITGPNMVYIFKNDKSRPTEKNAPLGCGSNFTLY
jgi:hypothetical protein